MAQYKQSTKTLMTVVVTSWLVLSMFYYKSSLNTSIIKSLGYFYKARVEKYNGTEDYLINTPGCYIPNYARKLRFTEAKDKHGSCGQRAVFIKKISSDFIFYIDMSKMTKYTEGSKNFQCCYRFARRSIVTGEEDHQLSYSPCVLFQNGTKAQLTDEVITVTCSKYPSKRAKILYEDAYILLKNIVKYTDHRSADEKKHWNVLILGMDTMSRARLVSSMAQTFRYFQQHDWLDYKGYQKMGVNTFPNLISILSGMTLQKMYNACEGGMTNCNDLLIWSKFRDADYVTAYGEDYLRLPDTFYHYKGFKTLPTDHYMRPFFLTGEKSSGNLICTKHLPSAQHVLDYASQFANSYKNRKFFGMFWLNSYSHNLDNLPSLFEKRVIEFFENLNSTGVFNNTFILFMSDHGIRFGATRALTESYYEERLPMLFMWTPIKFRKLYKQSYYNLQLNQNRLVTPFDVHITFKNILSISNNTVDVLDSEACPKCSSLFEEKSPYRTCADSGISQKWCTCHSMSSVEKSDSGAEQSLHLAVSYIQNRSMSAKTTPCMVCYDLKLKAVLRNHSYKINNKTYYVVAFRMTPGDMAFEATVENNGKEFSLLNPTDAISQYNTKGNCVKNPSDRPYCVCTKIKKCNKKHK